MRRHWDVALLVIATLVLFGLTVSVADAATPAEGCAKSYTRADFHRVAGKVYDGQAQATRFERRTLARVTRCQAKPRVSGPIIAKHRARYRNAHHYRLEVNRLTPYGAWAIPTYIVMCESGGSWTAWNPSGARGPYQFLGWRVPWPVRTRADKLAHHRMARYLWNDSPSHWVCA